MSGFDITSPHLDRKNGRTNAITSQYVFICIS